MLKKTKTRECVLNLIKESSTPLSAKDILECLKEDNITLSSIYRTLDTFTKSKIINKESNNLGIATYTYINEEHFHVLECKTCHKQIKLDFCPYHKANKEILKKTNFTADEHNVVIYGLCKNCKEK